MRPQISRGLSANTLFHFTSSLDNLLNILINQFHPNFCLENPEVLLKLGLPEIAVPLLSFCDIPLSQTQLHISIYGDYGIGMTKSWGMRNGIAPVLYTYADSLFMKRFRSLIEKIEPSPDSNRRIYDLMTFLKPYEGTLYRASGTLENVRFYDEREWRFLPELPSDFEPLMLSRESFLDDEKRFKANQKLASICQLSFEPKDIRYLVVRREEEIVPLMNQIKEIKSKYRAPDVILLTSRVMAVEHIRSDF